MMRWLSAGESHGPSLVGVLDGVPAGVELTSEHIKAALARRRLGYGRGARQKFEQDAVRILGGVRHGVTLGSPVAIEIANSEWPKWEVVMSADPVDPSDLLIDAGTGDEREVARNRRLTRPRPGHADFAGMMKFDHADARAVLERASARETATRVAVGEVARRFLQQVAGIEIASQVVQIGECRGDNAAFDALIAKHGPAKTRELLDADPVRAADADTSAAFVAAIDAAHANGDTIGGMVEVCAYHLPVGLGSYTQWDERLDARLAAALMSIPSAKTVAVGAGQGQVSALGSHAHDDIFPTDDGGVRRSSNRAGGVEGGMSNGEPVRVTVGFKPISTVPRPRATIDLRTGQGAPALHQRSDTCAVVPAAVIAEAMVAITLADAVMKMYGSGSVERIRQAVATHQRQVRSRLQGEQREDAS
ncbi:MAG: chorismate synthase [Actinomycetaceae bacterium]|nr:chorismate synthase [Actinomycetaceae bacterium]